MARIALITGGGSGLGRATAHAFAQAGMTVAVVDLRAEAAKAVAAELPGKGHAGYAVDVADEAGVMATFAAVEKDLGPVAVLATFAGIVIWPSDGVKPTLARLGLDEWERTYAVNCRGTFLFLREYMRRRTETPLPDGRIITVASSAAQIGGYNTSAAYVSSKGAILALTKIAAREAAPLGITVNAISPGSINTPLLRAVMPEEKDAAYFVNVPLGRVGQPADIAAAAAFLASPAAGYITGSCIDVNGGMRMQ